MKATIDDDDIRRLCRVENHSFYNTEGIHSYFMSLSWFFSLEKRFVHFWCSVSVNLSTQHSVVHMATLTPFGSTAVKICY